MLHNNKTKAPHTGRRGGGEVGCGRAGRGAGLQGGMERGWKVGGTAAELENRTDEWGGHIQKEESWRLYEGVSSLSDIK